MSGTCNLFIGITKGKATTYYRLSLLNPHPDVLVKAWKLVKSEGDEYHVGLDANGWWSCNCPAGTYRTNELCKHAKSLRAAVDADLLSKEPTNADAMPQLP